MANIDRLLQRLLELASGSNEYFVSESLSFLPLLDNYRKPRHDVDVAIAQELFEQRKHLFTPDEHVHFLSLSQVAIAAESGIARALSPRTGFVHVEGPDGLLDLSCYVRAVAGGARPTPPAPAVRTRSNRARGRLGRPPTGPSARPAG